MELIISDPNTCGGKPVVRGTGIMVRNILGMAAGGYDVPRIIKAYPQLAPEQVAAALQYADKDIDSEKVAA